MIGQGAFGKVYEAVTQNDGSAIAVKFLKREFWQNLESRSMFLREVDQASKVSHPNVVRYLGWGTSPHGGPFIDQQFIDGQPLSQMLGCSPEQFRDWLQEICDALNAIHQQRIIHGDLILLIAAAGVWGIRSAEEVISIPREAYASDWTAVFIIDHLRTSGTWPTSWNDLRDEYDRLAVPQHYAWSFDELQTLIDVNWESSVEAIRKSDVPLDNVQLRSGRQVSYNGDPDVLIHDYVHTGNNPHQIRDPIRDLGEPSNPPESPSRRFENVRSP